MLNKVSPAFLCLPNAQNKRVLHEGKVLDLDGRRVVIEFDDTLTAGSGAEVLLFAEIRGKFFQQGATITQQRQDAEKSTIEFHTVGDPVSAEQRGSFRTTVVTWRIPVRVDKLVGCTLADISPEGFGIICPKPLTIGTTVQASFDFDGHVISGPFRVQAVKMLPNGTMRFGLFATDGKSPARGQLQRLAGHAQRLQLKRLSGAA